MPESPATPAPVSYTHLDVYKRQDLIFTKEQLLAPLQEGMLAAPHPMVEGMDERDYYLGRITSATDEQRDWALAQQAAEAEAAARAAAEAEPERNMISEGGGAL